MTRWAKILVIVILVLSLVFAGMSTANFAKSQRYRQYYEKEKALSLEAQETLKKQRDQVFGDLQAKVNELEQTKTMLTGANENVARLTTDIKKQSQDLADANIALTQTKNQVDDALASVGVLTTRAETVVKENDALRAENLDFAGKLSKANDEMNNLSRTVAQLTENLEKTSNELSDAKKTIALNDEVFNRLSERNIEARTIIAGLNAVPDVKAKVLTVDRDSNMVVLNVGKNHNVRKNFEFTVWRDGSFVAKVNVFDVQDDLSAARIVTSKLPVQRGDNAWTRMQ